MNILWDHGPMTKERLADKLQDIKGIRQVPSPNSLSALLSKNPQVISVGLEKVVSANGISSKHMIFAIDSYLIQDEDDLLYTIPHNIMSPVQKKDAVKCPTCGRTRILPPDETSCLHCLRDE